MRICFRYLVAGDPAEIEREQIWEGRVVAIGSGVDQGLVLAGTGLPTRHSKITMVGSKLAVQSVCQLDLYVNGRRARRAVLDEQTQVDLGGWLLRIAFEPDYDAVIFIQRLDCDATDATAHLSFRLRDLKLPVRSFSWAFLMVILVAALIIPVLGTIPVMSPMETMPVPSDKLWLAGPLHDSHAFMGADCAQCHVSPFVPVTDAACADCHGSIIDHMPSPLIADDLHPLPGCADCHQDHNESGSIIPASQGLCADCHGDPNILLQEPALVASASDFLHDHPPFFLTMVSYVEEQGWTTFRAKDQMPVEESNLKFPHKVHLAENGINGPNGTVVLGCNDCHEKSPESSEFLPVTMEAHCASCHELTFDANYPDRKVSHGNPRQLMRELREFYAYQLILGERLAEFEVPVPRVDGRHAKRPGKTHESLTATAQLLSETLDLKTVADGQVLWSIEEQVARAAENLFDKQTCTVCHEVTTKPDNEVPWHVLPVKLNQRWMPRAEFNHEPHEHMQCRSCHDAAASEISKDVLMPGIDGCRECHGGETAREMLQSTCIACHEYHPDAAILPFGHHLEHVSVD